MCLLCTDLQAAGKLKNYENMTSEVEMARVLMTQQDNGHYKRLDSQRDLVNADGEISQIAFMSLLTAWFNWDIKGVFDTQPGFEPPPPPMPPFSDRVKYGNFHNYIFYVCGFIRYSFAQAAMF